MNQTENADVNQEVVTPAEGEVSQAHEQAVGQEVQSQGQEQVGQPEQDKDYNFKQIREANARLQRELEEERLAREADRARFSQFEQQLEQVIAPKTEEVDELAGIDKDDWTTRDNVEKIAQRQALNLYKKMREEDEKKRAEEEHKRYLQELPKKLESQHTDFNSVVTKENVEYLKANKPHIAATLAATKDPYAQALAAYDAIKAFCPSESVNADAQRMEQNANKPGTLGAAQAPSPLTEAKSLERGLTPEMKRKYQQEMIAAMRGS